LLLIADTLFIGIASNVTV